jgi:hypothetical protein
MPIVNRLALRAGAGARSHRDRDPAVIEGDRRLNIFVPNGQEIAPAPKMMRFPLNKLARRFAGLSAQFRLLVANLSIGVELCPQIGVQN